MSAPTGGTGCGRSIETLASYLDTGTSPDAAHISSCPQCQAGLAALRQLNRLTGELLAHDLSMAAAPEQSWLREILANLRLETRAGRAIPIRAEDHSDELSQTEGSVIALIRNVGDTIDGATIGRCRLRGDITVPGAPVDLDIRVSAFYGYRLPAMAERLRNEIGTALATHTELNLHTINITITDLRTLPGHPEEANP